MVPAGIELVVVAHLLDFGPLGFFVGGFVGTRLGGKWLKATSHPERGPENGKGPE
jgi:hypothetical protein